jgi:hypothetical protein
MAKNPTPTPGAYRRDVGSGDQLDYGDATDTNAELAAGDAVEEQIQDQALVSVVPTTGGMPAAEPGPVEYADDGPDYVPANEDEAILFGDSEGIGLEPSLGATRPIANSVLRALPSLSAIVRDPTTPPAIRAAYNLVLQRLAAELESNY